MYQNIMVAIDGGRSSERLMNEAIKLATLAHASLHIVTVGNLYELAFDETVRFRDEAKLRLQAEDNARQLLQPMLEKARAAGLDAHAHPVLSWGSGTEIAEALLAEAARHQAELFIMGTHGRTGLAHLFLGSVAEAIMRTADIPVVILRSAHQHHANP